MDCEIRSQETLLLKVRLKKKKKNKMEGREIVIRMRIEN